MGDARKLSFQDESVDVVLFFGPLYHLDAKDRQIALSEAYRVLKPKGLLFAQSVSKFTCLMNTFFDGKMKNPEAVQSIDDCLDGRFEYHGGVFYSHTAQELQEEIEKAGFSLKKILSVEGFGKWLNFENWENTDIRQKMLSYIERTEEEPSLIGLSSHIMAIGQKNDPKKKIKKILYSKRQSLVDE
jgi:SAM-dependent methyltransferase